MKATYREHHRRDAEGHIFIEKHGPCCIGIQGAASMTQQELDFWGRLMADAITNMTPAQQKQAAAFKPRKL